jgi:WD40 repeat protein
MLRRDQRQSLASYVKSQLQLWDVETGELIAQSKAIPSRPTSSSIRFLQDGKTVVSANGMSGGREVRIWSVADGVRELTYRKPKMIRDFGIAGAPMTTSDQLVTRVAVSPNGQSIAARGSYGMADTTTILKIWPTRGAPRRRVSHEWNRFYFRDLCWSPDGDSVVVLLPHREESHTAQGKRFGGMAGKGLVIVVRDAKDLDNEIFRKHYPDIPANSAGLMPISGTSWIAFPGPQGTVIVFDLSSLKEKFRLKDSPALVRCLAASRDGSLLVAGGSSSIVIWTMKTRDVFARSRIGSHSPHDLEFSPDGSKLAIAAHNLYMWDVTKFKRADPVGQ